VSLREAFVVAWRGLAANKLRSFLTALGVIIGVAAVIALVAVGQGASAQVTAQVRGLGANLIIVTPERNKGTVLTLRNVQDVPTRVPEVTAAMPVVQGAVTARWRDQSWQTTLQGVTDAFPQLRGMNVLLGRFLSGDDVTQRRRVAVLGTTVLQELHVSGNPVGQVITVNGIPFTVVGVLAPAGGNSGGQNQDDAVFAPVTAAQRLLGTTSLSAVYYQARDEGVAPLAAGHLQAVFDHKFGRDQSVRVLSQDQILSALQATTAVFTLMLGAIAGIALLVGGIGIMNIMLVSVAERTREIGIRKAVGAKRRHILFQFLLEATVLSVAGGLAGIGLGAAAARLLARFSQWHASVSAAAVAVAFGFALLVGLGFGVWPAVKAAALDPVEALRRE
jgi:putative ABC transport system permease protein